METTIMGYLGLLRYVAMGYIEPRTQYSGNWSPRDSCKPNSHNSFATMQRQTFFIGLETNAGPPQMYFRICRKMKPLTILGKPQAVLFQNFGNLAPQRRSPTDVPSTSGVRSRPQRADNTGATLGEPQASATQA